MGKLGKPRLLDLCCCQGGAARGYQRAGFAVVGVDIEPQPRFAGDTFIQGNALTMLDRLLAGQQIGGWRLADFHAIHASPPCQDYTRAKHIRHAQEFSYPRLIGPIRERLQTLTVPWVIENVADAWSEMPAAIMLCGTALGLRVWRHRLFESNIALFSPGPCRHAIGDVSVRRKHADYIGIASGVRYKDRTGYERARPKTAPAHIARAAMGIDWMTMHGLGEAVPPAYTEWLGSQIMAVIRNGQVA